MIATFICLISLVSRDVLECARLLLNALLDLAILAHRCWDDIPLWPCYVDSAQTALRTADRI